MPQDTGCWLWEKPKADQKPHLATVLALHGRRLMLLGEPAKPHEPTPTTFESFVRPFTLVTPVCSCRSCAQSYVTGGAVLVVIAVLCAWEPWTNFLRCTRLQQCGETIQTLLPYLGLPLAFGAAPYHVGCHIPGLRHCIVDPSDHVQLHKDAART